MFCILSARKYIRIPQVTLIFLGVCLYLMLTRVSKIPSIVGGSTWSGSFAPHRTLSSANNIITTKLSFRFQDHNSKPVVHPTLSSTGNITTELSFHLHDSFKIPWHNSKPLNSIVSQPWFHKLKTMLTNTNHHFPIVLVTSDDVFKKPLRNWLIAATDKQNEPIANIIVVTNSRTLCEFVLSKKHLCNCLVIPTETIIAAEYRKRGKYSGFYNLLIIRISVMRLLNHWGFDVANFDSDAIILKNPIPLFYSKEYVTNDIIGTFGGSLPRDLHKKWGIVVCMGAIFIRSTSQTEELWKQFEKGKKMDDQVKFNYGLDKMRVQWTSKNINRTISSDPLSVQWEGNTSSGLKITLLPQRMACRGSGCVADVRNSCYIWHKGKIKHNPNTVINASEKSGVWFYETSPK